MTRVEVRNQVVQALASVAPEVDPASLQMDVGLRDQVDLDSMDFLRFIIEVHRQFDVEVPETDYQHFATLNGAVDYVSARIGAAAK